MCQEHFLKTPCGQHGLLTTTTDPASLPSTKIIGDVIVPDTDDLDESEDLFDEDFVVPEIKRTLVRGARGEDVRMLQEFLAKDKDVYPEGIASGFFGPSTEAALKRWQKKQGLNPVGVFGLQSRAKLQEMRDRWERTIESEPADDNTFFSDLAKIKKSTDTIRRTPGLGKL